MSWFSPPQRPAPRGPKALRKLFLPLPLTVTAEGSGSAPHPPLPSFPEDRGHGSTVGGRGLQDTHPVRPHPGSPEEPGCPSAGRRFQQMVSAGEWTGVPWGNTGSRILAALGTRGVYPGHPQPQNTPQQSPHPAAHQEGQREASWSSSWAPSLPQSHHQTHFTETASIFPKVTQQRRCRTGVSLTP